MDLMNDGILSDYRNSSGSKWITSISQLRRVSNFNQVIDVVIILSYERINLCLKIICSCTKLQKIKLSCNKITTIPQKFCSANDNLVKLDLSCNEITTLPESFGSNMVNLIRLELNDNKLTSLPEKFGSDMISLTYLNMRGNQVTALPDNFGSNMVNLIILIFSLNCLTSLPETFGCNMVRLTRLYVTSNLLTTLPENFGHTWINLNKLELSNTRLTTLPENFGHIWINLNRLDLSFNRLTTLPENFGHTWTNLNKLDLSFNRLTLPENFGHEWINLNKLELSNNRLTALPENFGHTWINLNRLDLSDNRLTTLPTSLAQLRQLTHLDIFNNPIEYIPANVRRLLERYAQNIYNDSQSVHNSYIQDCVKQSISNLINLKQHLTDENVINLILSDDILNEKIKKQLIEYSTDQSIHTVLNITFKDVLVAVWNRITIHESYAEIKRILAGLMDDSVCSCFTGKVTRLISCLCTFDVAVKINISEPEQIFAIISEVGKNLKETASYSVDKHREIVTQAMRELNYSSKVIEEWTSAIE